MVHQDAPHKRGQVHSLRCCKLSQPLLGRWVKVKSDHELSLTTNRQAVELQLVICKPSSDHGSVVALRPQSAGTAPLGVLRQPGGESWPFARHVASF